ncbi:hypothetical protein J2Z66_002994 [Paenibacillus eucommiae]|uniref:Uncharacterized protein n=1 Tax=Paenibacillus eucommiae TaxID=1355755 RepID=A0ABS4IUW8_9BACL|nr:hypothetical protein [Paenibacillus eucommiae]
MIKRRPLARPPLGEEKPDKELMGKRKLALSVFYDII